MDRTLGNVVSEIVGQVTAVFAETRLSASPSPEPNLESLLLSSAGAPMPQERSLMQRRGQCSSLLQSVLCRSAKPPNLKHIQQLQCR